MGVWVYGGMGARIQKREREKGEGRDMDERDSEKDKTNEKMTEMHTTVTSATYNDNHSIDTSSSNSNFSSYTSYIKLQTSINSTA
jgi:hypothetical protein